VKTKSDNDAQNKNNEKDEANIGSGYFKQLGYRQTLAAKLRRKRNDLQNLG
jgi:hypothetical protein